VSKKAELTAGSSLGSSAISFSKDPFSPRVWLFRVSLFHHCISVNTIVKHRIMVAHEMGWWTGLMGLNKESLRAFQPCRGLGRIAFHMKSGMIEGNLKNATSAYLILTATYNGSTVDDH
jgi:hypothetical protein